MEPLFVNAVGQNTKTFLEEKHLSQCYYIVKVSFLRISMLFDSVNTGELPFSECIQ